MWRVYPLVLLEVLVLTQVLSSEPMLNPGSRSLSSRDRRLFRQAGLKVEGPALLNFLQRPTLSSPADEKRFARLIEALGAKSFAERKRATIELRAAGPIALPALRRAGVSTDLERARRARECLEAIECRCAEDPAVSEAVLRWLVQHQPLGAVEALVKYLPRAKEEGLTEEVLRHLETLTCRGSKFSAIFTAAATDPNPMRRATAAWVFGRGQRGEHGALLRRLLTDKTALVRFRAAEALVQRGDSKAVPVLLSLLGEAPLPIAWRAEELLGRLAGDALPGVALQGTVVSRRACRRAWEHWWRAQTEPLDLVARLRKTPSPRQVFIEGNRRVQIFPADLQKTPSTRQQSKWIHKEPDLILVLDGNCRKCWELRDLKGIGWDCQLQPSGRLLLTEAESDRDGKFRRLVRERDRLGRVVWEKRIDKVPRSCCRLPDGNTLIGTSTILYEVAPNGMILRTHDLDPNGLMRVRPFGKDQLAILTQLGTLVILTREGSRVAEFSLVGAGEDNGSVLESSVVLPNGHLLVSNNSTEQILEYDRSGQPVWHCRLRGLRCAVPLPNGHFLAGRQDRTGLIEIDPTGKVIHEYRYKQTFWTADRLALP